MGAHAGRPDAQGAAQARWVGAPHLWSGAPAFAAGITLAASQSAGLGANPLLHELVHEKFPVVDGQLEIPDRPGLGITVDEGFVRRHARE